MSQQPQRARFFWGWGQSPKAPLAAIIALSVSASSLLFAQAPPSSPPAPTSSSSAAPPTAPTIESFGTCIERIPEGKERPGMQQKIAPRGVAGHAHTLEVTIEHGKAEKVFPSGFNFNFSSEELKAFEKSGFSIPDPTGEAKPEISVRQLDQAALTTVKLRFVPLPEKAGRQSLVLAPLPITIARASGELITLCTSPHRVEVDPPIANTPSPKLKPNPPPRPQREIWEAAKLAALTGLIALGLGALIAAFIVWMKRRPKPPPPPPPPRPPWEIAIEALHDLRQRQLIQQERYDEHYAEVCLILRRYLGDRYQIGGQLGDAGALESTTEEILRALRRLAPSIAVLPDVEQFLRESDLVKFAKAIPTPSQCEAAVDAVESIVHRTMSASAPLAPLSGSTASPAASAVPAAEAAPSSTPPSTTLAAAPSSSRESAHSSEQRASAPSTTDASNEAESDASDAPEEPPTRSS